jgi:hypothetical protein
MVRILPYKITDTIGKTYELDSTVTKPTAGVPVDSILTETDTEDKYRYNQYGRWEFIPPISLKSKRIQTLFIPFTNQTGLIFGEGTWKGINAELHSSGCMVYKTRTSATDHDLGIASTPNHTYGYMGVNDFAIVELLPKAQMVFSFSDSAAGNSVAFIGLYHDSATLVDTTATFIPNDVAVFGIGYGLADTTIQVYHNDSSGAVTTVDTLIARSTDVYKIEIEYETSTSVRLSLFDIDMVLVFEDTYTTEIPPSGIDLGFLAKIQNANHTIQYGINMFDYIRLEKTRPPLSATLDF